MRIDMYLLDKAGHRPLELACRLTAKAWPGHRAIAICCEPHSIAELDRLLWRIPAGRFIAHAPAGSENADLCPVRIGARGAPADILINLHPRPAGGAGLEGYRRILDIVGPHSGERESGRGRYRRYRQLSRDLHLHRL